MAKRFFDEVEGLRMPSLLFDTHTPSDDTRELMANALASHRRPISIGCSPGFHRSASEEHGDDRLRTPFWGACSETDNHRGLTNLSWRHNNGGFDE